MIIENRNKLPFIHFGFNKQTINIIIGEEITVWQDSIYNTNEFDFSLTSVGSSIRESNYNKAVLTYNTLGSYTIEVNISDKAKSKTLTSNLLTVNVSLVTADSKTITADSSIILASG